MNYDKVRVIRREFKVVLTEEQERDFQRAKEAREMDVRQRRDARERERNMCMGIPYRW